MFESMVVRGAVVETVTAALIALRSPCGDDAARIDRLIVLDRAKAAIAAAEALDMVAFADSQLTAQATLRLPVRSPGRGIADQIGLATQRSPVSASRRLGLARTLVTQMPATLGVLAAGGVSELAVGVAVGEAVCLQPVDRSQLDTELATVVATMSVREVERAVRRRVIELDTQAVVRRAARAGPTGTSRFGRRRSVWPC